MTRLGQCYLHMLKQAKKDFRKCLVVKENLYRMLTDLKLTQKKSFTGMTDSLCGLLKKKHSNEIDFFDQFDEPCWNRMRDCWLSSELGAGIPRANNALECHMVTSTKPLLKISFYQQTSHWEPS